MSAGSVLYGLLARVRELRAQGHTVPDDDRELFTDLDAYDDATVREHLASLAHYAAAMGLPHTLALYRAFTSALKLAYAPRCLIDELFVNHKPN